MSAEEFLVIQEYLLRWYAPFIEVWFATFLAASILLAVLVMVVKVAGELLARSG